MLINVSQPEECRIAIVEDGVLEELYIERSQPGQLRRQYLQGKHRQSGAEHPGGVRRFRRGPQRLLAHQRRRAAVLPPGRLRSGRQFDGWRGRAEEARYRRGRRRRRSRGDERRGGAPAAARSPGVRPRVKPPIQEIFRRGDEVLVQVIKEGIGTKGPHPLTYISIPGRYLVLMPALGRVGVSRKIEDDDDRRRCATSCSN
jgi:ribonuclease E